MTLRIEPYKAFSKGARELSNRCGILRATKKQTAKHGTFGTLLNWGNSERRFANATYINNPEAVAIASNKLSTAKCLGDAGVPQPVYTTRRSVAEEWAAGGTMVCCRKLLRASEGRGLVLYEAPATGALRSAGGGGGGRDLGDGRDDGRGRMVDAPLYTKYFKKAEEYRVHVFDGVVIDVQQKRKRQEVDNEDVNYQIRNSRNGWVFCRDGVDCPDLVTSASIAAVTALGLDFGAVDVGFNVHRGEAAVFEVNTAPGLEGTTLDRYFEAIAGRLGYIRNGAYGRRRRGEKV